MEPSEMLPAMQLALVANFGSVAAWRTQFDALVTREVAGAGHAMLVFDAPTGALRNHGATPAADVPAGSTPLLVWDLPERPVPIDWSDVYARYQAAVHAASEPLGTDSESVAGSRVLDVRRAGVFEQAATQLPGAAWRNPAQVAQWAGELPRGTPITVYCVYGHEVSRSTALRLRAAGLDARYLRGGIDGWTAAGRPVVAKGERS